MCLRQVAAVSSSTTEYSLDYKISSIPQGELHL